MLDPTMTFTYYVGVMLDPTMTFMFDPTMR
jgi:hypothetical protein